MTWEQIAQNIRQMTNVQRAEEVLLIRDYQGPDQLVRKVTVTRAEQDVYDGISIGNELVLSEGDFFLQEE